jgi:Family of unknown function (DUF6527)
VKQQQYTFQFVEFMPKTLDEGVLYISMTYATASHICFCGCGKKVVTPVSPTDWRMTFNGDSVSLDPSVGNWSYPCRSHYILRGNRVIWAGAMTDSEIRTVREGDAQDKARYYQGRKAELSEVSPSKHQAQSRSAPGGSYQRRLGWRRILDWF